MLAAGGCDDDPASPGRLFNPPFVQALAFSQYQSQYHEAKDAEEGTIGAAAAGVLGRSCWPPLCAVALGDGRLVILEMSGAGDVEVLASQVGGWVGR